MTLRFSTSRAIGAAIVLTLGSVASAAAQTPVRKDVPANPSRMPVTKDRAPVDTATPAPAPAPAPTYTPAPAPAPMTESTTMTTTTTTSTSTGELPPAAPTTRFGNGFYIGVGAKQSFPQNRLNDVYRSGFGVEVPIGWDPANSPLGVRLNLGYTRLRGDRERFDFNQPTVAQGLKDPQVYQAVADAKLRLPFGHFLGATSGLYAVGGGGMYYFRNYQNTLMQTVGTGGTGVTNTFNPEDKTQFGANVGGGVSWGLGRASLYVESRYVRIFTPNTNSDMVPVVLGVTFH